jgi:hypothetical protein
MTSVIGRLDELAVDVARLRRRVEPDSSLAFIAVRIAEHVESLDVMLQPSAAELAACAFPGDAETLDAAVEHVERRANRLRGLLGLRAA